GLAALLWLAARRRFYGTLELKLTAAPLLAVQLCLSIAGTGLLLGLAFLVLVLAPDPGAWLLDFLAEIGLSGGWLGLLLPMSAALWYTTQLARRGLLPLGIAFALGLGLQAACTVCHWDSGNWLAFHVLLAYWSLTGLVVLALGLIGSMPE